MTTPRREDLAGPAVWVVHDLLSADECQEQTRFAETIGFDDAPITTTGGPVMRPDIRNNTRVMVDSPDRAAALWARLGPLMRSDDGIGMPATRLNERLRYYRYDPGQQFAMHLDGYWQPPDSSERSLLTLMVYLNDGFEGGETWFPSRDLVVTPQAGMALLFLHAQLHEGRRVLEGRKYVLRTDVMFDLG